MIKSLIFDLDGTLFDTSEANIVSYDKAFSDCGLKLNKKLYIENFGLRYNDMIDKINPNLDSAVKRKIKILKSIYYKENLALVKPNIGLISLLSSLGNNYRSALVTTASRENVQNLLSFNNIEPDIFNIIITGEDVDKGKPDPECYLKAFSKLGVDAKECCVFEDSKIGIEAAEASGANVIKVRI